MSEHGNGTAEEGKSYPIEEALRAQKALRELAGMGQEMFPMPAFVGMISDEIEALRKRGHDDAEIARTISMHSKIEISADEIRAYYAPPEQRHGER